MIMSSIVRLRAPESWALHKMHQQEIEKLVTAEAERMLDAMPTDLRLVGVNAVSVDQKAADVDVWAQWTRACCGSRARIEEFVDPVLGDISALTTTIKGATDQHFESHLTVQDNRFDHISEDDVKR
jgi:hypothetical protein